MAAKKNYHSRVSMRKKREEQKLAQRREFVAAHRKQLIIGGVALVLLVIAAWLLLDYFVIPGGSLRTFMGKVVDPNPNAIIREINGRYYEFAVMDAPEGYTATEYDVALSRDPQEQMLYFESTDADRAIKNILLSGVKEKNGEEMIAHIQSSPTAYSFMSEARHATLGGHEVVYLYALGSPSYDMRDQKYATLCMYVDAMKGSSVLVQCSSDYFTEETVPAEEAMLAEAEVILQSLKVW